jgi:hypothetical protein
MERARGSDHGNPGRLVSIGGEVIAFITSGMAKGGDQETAWVLPVGAAPGSLTARPRKSI